MQSGWLPYLLWKFGTWYTESVLSPTDTAHARTEHVNETYHRKYEVLEGIREQDELLSLFTIECIPLGVWNGESVHLYTVPYFHSPALVKMISVTCEISHIILLTSYSSTLQIHAYEAIGSRCNLDIPLIKGVSNTTYVPTIQYLCPMCSM